MTMTYPSPTQRVTRILNADTGVCRLVIAAGLLIVGAAMLLGFGDATHGAKLMANAMPLPAWAVLFILVGGFEVYGVFGRVPFLGRVALCLAGAFVWVVIALSENSHVPTPTRFLLVLPAVVELWVLIKVSLLGRREE